ncbi:MAG: hypothetical protein WBP59_02465, partial [Ilumatobacteraceae bacterium]
RDPDPRLELQTLPDREFEDIAAGAFDELTWVYRATGAVDSRAQILVTGTLDSGETTTNGEADIVGVTDILLEGSIVLDDQELVSGRPIRFSGHFKNVTDGGEHPRTVTFAIERTFSAGPIAPPTGENKPNGGNGWFTTAGSSTPTALEFFELEAGQEIDLDAIVHTLEAPEWSGFTIEYSVFPYAPAEDDEGNIIEPITFEPADPRQVELSDEEGSSETHRVLLDAVQPTPEVVEWLSCAQDLGFSDYLGCKFTKGVQSAAAGLWEIGKLGWDIHVGIAQGLISAYRTYIEVMLAEPEARQVIIDEIVAELTVLKARGLEALDKIDVTELPDLVGDAMFRAIQRIDTVVQTGDIKLILGEMSQIVGENVDMLFEALVAARVAIKATLALGGRTGLLRSAIVKGIKEESQESIDAAFRVIAEQGERALPASRVMKAGVDITDYPKLARAWGVSPDEAKAILRIAEDQGVTIVFRSRSPKSIELIKDGTALGKPQGVKTKGVSQFDIDYLDYPQGLDSVVAVIEPPIKTVGEIDAYVNSHPKVNALAEPMRTDTRNMLKSRLETRIEEWDSFEADRLQWERLPTDRIDGKQGGIKIDFDPAFNDLPREYMTEVDNVRARIVDEPDLPDGRKVHRIQMEGPPGSVGPDGSPFFDITGDIDFLAILSPDGRMLGHELEGAALEAALKKRAKIYELLQGSVGMRHGESFSIPKEKLRTKYMKDGVNADDGETLLAATPAKRLLTTYFDDGLSTLLGGPNGDVVRLYERSFFEGLYKEVLSPTRGLDLLGVADVIRAMDDFKTIGQYFGLSIFARITGLASDSVEPEFDRSGKALQPGEDGGVAEYTAPPSTGSLTTDVQLLDAAPYDPQTDGAAGGRWRDVDAASLVADGPVGLRPWTYIDDDVVAGATEVPALAFTDLEVPTTSDYFEIGDVVVVDPGGADEELVELASILPMRFATALANDHEAGTMVLLAHPAAATPDDDVSMLPLVPARLMESRPGRATIDGAARGFGRVAAGSTTSLKVVGRGGVPGDALAVMLNVTVVDPLSAGYVTVFPCGSTLPLAANLNFVPGDRVPNAVLAKVGTGGEVCVYSSAATDLVVDVNGFVP